MAVNPRVHFVVSVKGLKKFGRVKMSAKQQTIFVQDNSSEADVVQLSSLYNQKFRYQIRQNFLLGCPEPAQSSFPSWTRIYFSDFSNQGDVRIILSK